MRSYQRGFFTRPLIIDTGIKHQQQISVISRLAIPRRRNYNDYHKPRSRISPPAKVSTEQLRNQNRLKAELRITNELDLFIL
jgi:hypothetical protein